MSQKLNTDLVIKSIFYLLIFRSIIAIKYNNSTKEIRGSALDKMVDFGDSLLGDVSEGIYSFTKGLEGFNDRNFGRTSLAKILHYEDLKPSLEDAEMGKGKTPASRNIKKMGMAMMPLVFHVGASSTWLVLIGLMTFKSVALMTLLLVFKIAVSAAKVSAFFTHHFKEKEYVSWSSPQYAYPHDHEHAGRYLKSSKQWSRSEPPTATYRDPFLPST